MANTGVYYIATGEEFVSEAELSAKSVRDSMPDIPIAIATDRKPDFDFDEVVKIEDPAYGFADQIHNLHRSPFDRTLHLDSDIYMYSNVEELFSLLDQFDLAAAHNHDRKFQLPALPKSFPEYNTGVLVYENDSKFREFTRMWADNYYDLATEDRPQNQPSFRKTLYESDLRIATLTPEYNCMIRYPGHVRNKVKIFHSRLIDIPSPGASYLYNIYTVAEQLNEYDGHRIYKPSLTGAIKVYHRHDTIYHSFTRSVRRDGILDALRKAANKLIN